MQEKSLKPTQKPVVQYLPFRDSKPVVGFRAEVIPLDHPDTYNIDNGRWASTSIVKSVNEDGSFETQNTLYVLAEQAEAVVQ